MVDKKKALETAIAQLDKQYGKGTVMRLGEHAALNVEAISTGSISLDIALGIGGVPKGRIIEVYGPESSGKTTLALHIVAEAQKKGGEAAFIDAEHALDPVYARALGRSGAVDVIVIDSVAALVPRAELEGEMGDSHVGLIARLMSQAMRKITGAISKSNCTAIFINQLREKVGVFYGNPEVTTGGRALKFYSSVRMEVRKGETLKAGGEAIGNRTKVKIVKNKVAPPFKEVEFDMMYGKGISKIGELVDLGVKLDLVQKSGAWFSIGEIRIGQGRDNAKTYLMQNTQVAEKLEADIREALLHSGEAREKAAPVGRSIDVSIDDILEE